ncbi:hypothetical protein JL722_775 [Aureococcus anophagefferens]|nr:hypothetical protein JL722_775 [Aureococcus anophagefferens]
MILDAESATKAAYVADVAAVVARPRAAAGAKPRQATAEIAALYRDGGGATGLQRVVADVVAALPCAGAELSIPDALKRSQRVVEKAALKRDGKGDVSSVLDVVRAMIVVKKLDHARLALLGLAARDDALEIVRVKERFFDAPSRGGWRDLMVNVRVSVDGVAHVCEIQIVHEMLLTARKGLPGHDVYARVRNATELLESKLGADVAGDALSLAFLHEATGGGHAVGVEGARSSWDKSYTDYSNYSPMHHSHKSGHQVFLGDKGWLSDAPPGEWLGVTADPVTGRVVGLELRDKGLKNSFPSDVAKLDKLESIDLRTNPDLAAELQEGLRLLDLLDMTGQMHFTDKERTQRFLHFIALSDDERSRIVEDAREVDKFGPDAHVLRALVSSCGGTQKASQRRWFDKEEDVRKWCGVELDDAKRLVSLNIKEAGLTSITALPERLGNCAALTTLDLGGCSSLTTAALERLGDCAALTTLGWCPSLTALPERLGDCAALTSLNLHECSSLTTAALERLGDCAALTTLDLRECKSLTALPERLGDCAALTSLNLEECRSLTALPERLGDCAALTSLNLHECSSLTALPERLGDCAALTTLNLENCMSLTAVPERLGDCAALTTLNLSGCRSLTALSERLGDCAALTTLNLSWCWRLTALPDLSQLTKLQITSVPKHLSVWTAHGHQRYNLMDDFFPSTSTHIDMEAFQGAALPERLGDCAALMSLDLRYCRSLTALPERLGDCAALTTLDLRDCSSLTALPERLGDCAALTSLNLWCCSSLTALPERLGDCAALTTLHLDRCSSLTALPERLGDCAALTTLHLDRCSSLTALPERLGDCAALTTLHLYGCKSLTALPERLGDCAALTSLDLHECSSLTALPERLGDCAALTTLDLRECSSLTTAALERLGDCAALTSLDLYECSSLTAAALERLGNCAALTTLNLGRSLTTAALERLGDCAALTTLDLRGCLSLTTLPERLGDCAALTTLYLGNCSSLAALPERLGDCAALTSLNLGYCESLTALPERLGDCAALTRLDLGYCESLTALPERLGDCAALTRLDLQVCSSLTALPERLGDCAALTSLNLRECRSLTALPERLGDCAALTSLNLEVPEPHRAARAARRLRGADDAEPAQLQVPRRAARAAPFFRALAN